MVHTHFSYGIYSFFTPQVCPQAADVVELFIYLAEPCHVCQLLLTIAHGADDSTFPSTVDVRTGRTLDGLKLVLEVCFTPSTHLVSSESYGSLHCNSFLGSVKVGLIDTQRSR